MNANGKKMRKASGENRHELRHRQHPHKSAAKIRRMNWKRIKKSV